MLVNADFTRRARVAPHQYHWVASPQQGVQRMMLDRVGAEQGHATSIVRYAPRSCFPRHSHPGGEEILVLSGVFSAGDQEHFPAGFYLRNPPGSSHQPSSEEGALLFVKLWQMAPDEAVPVRVDTRDPAAWRLEDGREICALFSSGQEEVSLQRLPAGERLCVGAARGAELLVISGGMVTVAQDCEAGTWLRLPGGDQAEIQAGAGGVTFYLKTRHGRSMDARA